ncbi:MAG: TetR/AcrR family transcriptional regulator [Deinococcota bacterium]
MPRHAEFDAEVALDLAMQQFWSHGYNNTSIEDLVNATGVSRYGLYGTFGDKRALFIKALDNYCDHVVTGRLQQLEAEGAGWLELEAFFNGFVELAKDPQSHTGCLILNTAIELAPYDATIRKQVDGAMTRFQTGFRNALRNAKTAGDVSNVDLVVDADVLVGLTQAIFLFLRLPNSASRIKNMVDGVLSKLR